MIGVDESTPSAPHGAPPSPAARAGYVTLKVPFMVEACGSHTYLYVPLRSVTV